MNDAKYLEATKIIDFNEPSIEKLVTERKWERLSDYEKIGKAYHFVKDEILFGYNAEDNLTASRVLKDGYGQCNTKGNLIMALFRKLNIPCRLHGFTIDKPLQKGAIPSYLYFFTPANIIHSWVEVYFQGEWINLEGFIIDPKLLKSVQLKHNNSKGTFSGFGIATKCLAEPNVDWQGKSTYIQKEGINNDFGVYDNPDQFYKFYGTNLSGIRGLLYRYILRHLINLNVRMIRRKFTQSLN
ncbi:MAG: transglutaminase [Kangiella sp.]|nr:MAG: transglutaminase [Kangiella sp.]